MDLINTEITLSNGQSYKTISSDSVKDIIGKLNHYYVKRGCRHLHIKNGSSLKVIKAKKL